MKKFHVATLLLISIFLLSCSKETLNAIEGVIKPTLTPLNTPTEIVIEDSNTGIVTGVLLFKDGEITKPVSNVSMFLAEVLKDENGIPRVVSMNRTDSPRAATDIKGQFVFLNVPPGEFGLVLDIVIKAYLLPEPDSDTDLIITVESDKIIDLGSLQYDANILPGFSSEP